MLTCRLAFCHCRLSCDYSAHKQIDREADEEEEEEENVIRHPAGRFVQPSHLVDDASHLTNEVSWLTHVLVLRARAPAPYWRNRLAAVSATVTVTGKRKRPPTQQLF